MKIGYALGGGAGYGFAHIGVLEVFEKYGIKPDIIAGTSVGSLIGGFYASGFSAEQIKTLAMQQINWNKLLKFTLPKEGLLSLDGLNEIIEKNIKIKNIEETKIKFAAVATDLYDNKEKIFFNGPISSAIRASCSIPGIFTPFKDGNHIYVDGGFVNNLPIKIAFDMGADFVIGVDITAKAFGLQMKQIDIFNIIWKSLQVIIQRNTLLENYSALSEKCIVIEPDVSQFNPFDLSKKSEILQKGREAAEEKIGLILSRLKEKQTLADKIKAFFK
jgi:NTE family protein